MKRSYVFRWFLIVSMMAFGMMLLAQVAMAQEVTSNAEEVNGVPTNLFMWAALVGFLASPVISVLNRSHWSSELKAIAAFGWCIVGAFGTVLFSNQFDAKNLATTVLLVLFSATGTYKAFWQPSGIAGRIEKKTG